MVVRNGFQVPLKVSPVVVPSLNAGANELLYSEMSAITLLTSHDTNSTTAAAAGCAQKQIVVHQFEQTQIAVAAVGSTC